MEFQEKLPCFIKNFLKKKKFQVRIGDIVSDHFNGYLYVDDYQIRCSNISMSFIERQLQIAINNITNWTNKNGFVLLFQKTACVHFCKFRRLHLHPETLNGVLIPAMRETKFFGIHLDSKL